MASVQVQNVIHFLRGMFRAARGYRPDRPASYWSTSRGPGEEAPFTSLVERHAATGVGRVPPGAGERNTTPRRVPGSSSCWRARPVSVGGPPPERSSGSARPRGLLADGEDRSEMAGMAAGSPTFVVLHNMVGGRDMTNSFRGLHAPYPLSPTSRLRRIGRCRTAPRFGGRSRAGPSFAISVLSNSPFPTQRSFLFLLLARFRFVKRCCHVTGVPPRKALERTRASSGGDARREDSAGIASKPDAAPDGGGIS